MKLADNDVEENYFQSVHTGNDKIVSYLFVCVTLLLFFAMFAFALNRAQTGADQLPRESLRQVAEPRPEIGDLGEMSKN